jgi:uncharacterized membrane protein
MIPTTMVFERLLVTSKCIRQSASSNKISQYFTKHILLYYFYDIQLDEEKKRHLASLKNELHISEKEHLMVIKELGWSAEDYESGWKGYVCVYVRVCVVYACLCVRTYTCLCVGVRISYMSKDVTSTYYPRHTSTCDKASTHLRFQLTFNLLSITLNIWCISLVTHLPRMDYHHNRFLNEDPTPYSPCMAYFLKAHLCLIICFLSHHDL